MRLEKEIPRLLQAPGRPFFLFGPRGVGKSTWLQSRFPDIPFFNLLDTRLYLELSRNPNLLEAKIGSPPKGSWIGLDEVQKIPSLLDEVHRLMESRRWNFILSGSSARKLKRGGANLLGGRAVTRHLEPFSCAELGKNFDIKKAIEWGSLPLIILNPGQEADILDAYVHTYIKEEIREEGALRKVEPFLRFLEVAGIMNGQVLNASNIARDAHIPRSSVDVYFGILEDTLLAHWLPAYQPQAKVREQTHPKFYWFDSGVARAAAGLLRDPADSIWLGTALETMIFHELRVYNQVSNRLRPITYYGTGNSSEIDFIIETKKRTASVKPSVVCLEVKYASKWERKWEKPMRSLALSGKVKVEKMIGIYQGRERYLFDDIEILPVLDFLNLLHKGEIF